MAEFERENRYIVIKRNDLDKLYKDPTKYATTFGHALALIAPHLPKRQYLVIESDWPEFEPAWRMIERRVAGLPDELALLREDLTNVRENSTLLATLDDQTIKTLGERLRAAEQRNAELIAAVRENHEWHIRYDEHDGYVASGLYETNTAALKPTEPGAQPT